MTDTTRQPDQQVDRNTCRELHWSKQIVCFLFEIPHELHCVWGWCFRHKSQRYESRPKKGRIFICENNFIPSWDEVCLTPFTSSQTCRIYPSQQRWLSNIFRHFFKFKRKMTNHLYPSPSINPKCVCSDLAKCGCLATTIWQSTYTWPTPWLHLLTKKRKKTKGKILFTFIFLQPKVVKMA